MKRNIHAYSIILLVLCMLLMSGISFFRMGKKTSHIADEMFAMKFANDTDNIWDFDDLPYNEKVNPSVLDRMLSVNEKNPAFNYKIVWKNQHADQHPPFYYALLHTISSVFREKYSKWFGFAINILFANLTVLFIYKLGNLLTEKKWITLAATFLYAVNPLLIENNTFIRMYGMCTFFCVLMNYLIVKYKDHLTKGFYIGNVLIFLTGFLTQYYFMIYTFFLYVVLFLSLVIKKRWVELRGFLISTIVGAGASVAIFPGMGHHFLGGAGGGSDALHNVFNIPRYFERCALFFGRMNAGMFRGLLPILLGIALVGLILNWKTLFQKGILYILTPLFCYFVLISNIAYMAEVRYMILILPILLLTIGLGVGGLFDKLFAKKPVVAVSLLLIIFVASTVWGYRNRPWMYTQDGPVIQDEAVLEADCIYVIHEEHYYSDIYDTLRQFHSITLAKEEDYKGLHFGDYQGDVIILIGQEEDVKYLVDQTKHTTYEVMQETILGTLFRVK